MADYPGAIDYFVDDSRVFVDQNSCETLVLHGTGGNAAQTAQQLGDWFRSDPNMASSHYGIDRSGVIAQYVREKDGAAANCCVDPGYDPFWQPFLSTYGNLNKCSISIECVNDGTNSLALTDPQKESLFNLVAYLVQKYHIPLDHIKTHASIAPLNRARCPGPAYPLDELIRNLPAGGNISMSTIPQGWADDGQTLTAPNGHKVALGFRNWILQNGIDKLGQPLEEEHGANPVEEYWSQTPPDGTRQLFNFGELGYTKARGAYLVGIGNELRGARADRDKARADLKAAQAQIVQLQQQLAAVKSSPPASADQINHIADTLATIISSAQACLHYLGKV